MRAIYYWIALIGLALIASYFRIQEYEGYKKYNGMKGVVIDTYTSQGRRSSTELPTIRLEDGSVGSINGGYHKWVIGESYTNEIGFNWFFGTYGVAYCINPDRNYFKVIFCMIVTLTLIVSLIMFGISRIKWE